MYIRGLKIFVLHTAKPCGPCILKMFKASSEQNFLAGAAPPTHTHTIEMAQPFCTSTGFTALSVTSMPRTVNCGEARLWSKG